MAEHRIKASFTGITGSRRVASVVRTAAALVAVIIAETWDRRHRADRQAALDRKVEATIITTAMTVSERRRYEAWLNSPSSSTPHGDEMVIAFRLALLLDESPTKVIRSLRGQRGQPPAFVERMERIVSENRSIHFVQDGRMRRVAFVPRLPLRQDEGSSAERSSRSAAVDPGGGPSHRTGDTEMPASAINLDADLRNSDWTKQTWDIWHHGKLVTTAKDLRAVLGSGVTVDQFLCLPAAKAMPEALRAELAAEAASRASVSVTGNPDRYQHTAESVPAVAVAHRQMAEPTFRRGQEAGIRLPHVAPFNDLVDELRDCDGRGWMPYVAPLYGGVNAEMINIFRDPGPGTNPALRGSGFLCLENDDPAAERLAMLLDEVGISAHRLMPWNAYPWYINRKPQAAEIDAGLCPLCRVLRLVPRLKVVMLNGQESHSLWKKLVKRHPTEVPDVRVIPTYHASNQAFYAPADERERRLTHLRMAMREAADVLDRD